MRRAAVVLVLSLVAARAGAADFQPPELRAPERGSIAGDYAGVAFGASELDRGAFRLPAPLHLPSERGAIGVDVFPGYAPQAGVSEYGVGWETPLSIQRFRPNGDLDYATDERVGPWGRLVHGSDGDWYPLGMAQLVRVHDGGDTLTAYLADGTVWTFGGTALVRTARGVYAWYLTDVTTVTGRNTHLTWSAGQGRSFLDNVEYGGVGADRQYRVRFAYESTPSLFVSYASGEEAALDRRVKSIVVEAKSAATGAWSERWHYALSYATDAWGPAFYLTTIAQTFASGESPPPVTFTYNRAEDWLAGASFTPAPSLAPVLQQLGGDILSHARSTLFDADDDGRADLEDAATQTLARRTDAGFSFETLPPPGAIFGGCRPDPSPYNLPRNLVKLWSGDGAYHVLDLEPDGGLANTTISACARDGTLQWQQTVAGDWAPGALTRVADVNRDHAPDVVQVGYGFVSILPNASDATGMRFDTPTYATLSPAFQPVAAWIHDFNGDGLPDLVARDSSNVVVWLGLGGLRFAPEGQVFTFDSDTGGLSSLDGYDVEFLDANHDGLTDVLLAQAGAFYLFVNDGFRFVARPLPALGTLAADDPTPVFADLTGDGNAALVVNHGGAPMSLALDQPGTGLLAAADDGRGTLLRFAYARAAASPGVYQRPIVLAALSVAASGYDSVDYRYDYAGARAHGAGHYLVGFDTVTRRDPTTTLTQSFLNDDDLAGVEVGSTRDDALTPAVRRFDSWVLGAAQFAGVRWMRPASHRQGWSDAGGSNSVEQRTDYLAYDADFCAATIQVSDAHGTLTIQRTRDNPSQLASSLHCLVATEVKVGKHADARLDFRHEQHVTHDARGLPLVVSDFGAQGELVTQRIAYRPDGTVASVSSPATGTSTFAWNDKTHLLDGIVAFDGTTTNAHARDPVTDGISEIASAHGSAVYTQWFRYDGQERLAKSWDSVGQASETNPDTTLAYRFATATQPASISARTLVDAATASARTTVDFMTASGEAVTGAQLVPGGWVFDRVGRRVHARAETTTAVRPALASGSDAAATDWATLFAGNDVIATHHASSFGIDADTTTRLHSDVTRTTSAALAVSNGVVVHSETENGTLTTRHALDAEQAVVGYDDQAGTHWSYGYDVLGRLRVVSLPDGSVHRVDIDDYGRDARVRRDGIGGIDYVYDATTGLMTEARYSAADGTLVRTADNVYDGAGRKVIATFTDVATKTSSTFDYYYDGATPDQPLDRSRPGLLTAIRGDGFDKRFDYRADGRLARRTLRLDGWRSIETSFDYAEDGSGRGHTTIVRDCNGVVLSTTQMADRYDASGRLATITLGGAPLATLGYDGNSQIASAALPGGSAAFHYDPLTRALVGTTEQASSWLADNAWKLDARGFVGSELITVGQASATRSYSYDAPGYLVDASDAHAEFAYDYDVVGLPTRIRDNDGDRTLARSGATLTAGADVYTLDGSGRTVARDDLTLTYGPMGQIATATRGSARWTFKYDEQGQRLLKLDGSGAPVAAYLPEGFLDAHGLVEPLRIGKTAIGVIDNGVFRMVPLDHRGTALGDTDGTARPASPYGNRAQHPDLAAAIDYIGRGWDADLGIVRMGARDYDPRIARFWTPDPLFLAHPRECVRSPVECGLYGYARNNPLSFADPDGTAAQWLHDALDVASFVPLVGGVADLVHAGVYATEGRWLAAGASVVISIPFLHEAGEAVKMGRAVYKGTHVVVAIGEHYALRGTAEIAEKAGVAKVEEESAAHEAAEETKTAAADAQKDVRRIDNAELKAPPSKRGNAPIGEDGHPVELHHDGQKPDSPLVEMTRTKHRGKGNFKANHPNTGQHPSEIDRKEWRKEQNRYWKGEWDRGRFEGMKTEVEGERGEPAPPPSAAPPAPSSEE